MRTVHSLLVLLALLPSTASGQNGVRELRGELFSIEDGEQSPKFFVDILVTIPEFGARGKTVDHGVFHIQLPAGVLAGQEVTLRHDKKGYAICSPLFGKQVIPGDPTKLVQVRMLPEGSKLFWTHQRIEEFVERTANVSARQIKDQQAGQADLSAYVLELARQYGFTPEEVRREIKGWMEDARKDTTDFRRRGLANFAAENFGEAARDFIEGAVRNEKLAAEKLREAAKDRGLAGDAFYNAGDYEQALAQYQKALKSLDSYRANLGDLGRKVYPEYTNDVAGLSVKAANTRVNLGERMAGPDGRRHLEEAVQEYERLIAEAPRAVNPAHWAGAHNNLGNALHAQGERTAGADGVALLARAADARRLALEVRTRQDAPLDWAMTQNNLGRVLSTQGERSASDDGTRFLARAVDAYRLALEVCTRQDSPRQWAMLQINLGNALFDQGQRTAGADGAALLARAADAYRLALEVYTQQDAPQQWAAAQDNLGAALRAQGERTAGADGVALLARAADAHRLALEVRTRQDAPQQWARTQVNLGSALYILGKRTDSAALLARAVDAYRRALQVFTRQDTSFEWAMTHNNLGAALRWQAVWTAGADGAALLARAADAYRLALQVFTREHLPQQWAMTQNNLSNALRWQGEWTGGADGAALLAQAVNASELALQVFTRQDTPLDWATAQDNLGNALHAQGERTGGAAGAALLARAVDAYRLALEVYTRQHTPQDWARTQHNLGNALQALATLQGLPACIQQVGQLSQDPAFRDDPAALAPLRALAVVCHAASGHDVEARRALDELVALVQHQPGDFRLAWDWERLRDFITGSKDQVIKDHSNALLRLIDAVSRSDCASILAGLKETREALETRDGKPGQPRK